MAEILDIHFDTSELDPRLHWYCPPERWTVGDGRLVVEPGAKTDYWQRTHYGFQNDNGPFLFMALEGNFTLSTRVRFYPAHQYDQAGLMVRISPDFWLKTSVEFEPGEPSKLGVVVTNYGYSDWSTQDFSPEVKEVELRVRREGDDYTVEHRTSNGGWSQLRLAHLHNPERGAVKCGLYACSPIEAGYRAEFGYLIINGLT